MKSLLQSPSLVKRAYWLVHLRWPAIGLLGAATFVASNILGVSSLPVLKLYLMAAVLVVYNYFLYDLLKYFTWPGRGDSHVSVSRLITFQISADLVILTTILHYSGGIENPFFFFFVFHMIIASILLRPGWSYLQATLAVCLFGGLVLLEYTGSLYHYKLIGFTDHDLYRNRLFVSGTFLIFAATLYLVVYMTTSICDQLRRQQESFERANIQLQEKDRFKNEYVLRLTHDIKGHIAAIQSCLNIVTDRIVGPLNDKQQDLVERAERRAGKCMAFITELLKLTRMKLVGQIEMQNFTVKNAIFNALAAAEALAAKKNIKLSYELGDGVDEVYGEPVLIEEAISNLLFNAVQYTPPAGTIRLIARDQDDYMLLQVADTGIGIPEDELGKIFEEFYRAENARQVERDGTGLGLSIARQVVERHHGRIWAQNNPSGGSTFSFTLPKQKQSGGDCAWQKERMY